MKKLILGFAVLVATLQVEAQDLYMPRNIQKAYANGTRDISGAPGKNYWQNGAIYNMKIKVDAQTKIVSGSEIIEYSNNSPDDLKTLVLRFEPNLHKPQSSRGHYVPEDFLSAGLTIKSLTVNGETYQTDSNFGTVTGIRLKNAIAAKSKAEVKIEWEYPLSKMSGREGQIDDSTFFVAYSYPKISVYDDYNGWNTLEHTDRQEFYNDFNSFNAEISAPKNFVVWSAGDLLNPEEVLQPEFLKRYQESLKTDKLIHVATEQEMKSGKVTQQNDWNVWKFKAENITDFTFALSDHYVWDASSVQLKTKRVSVQSAYKSGAKDFEQYVGWMQYNLPWFSENWPGVEYPFSKMTAVQGFADMEYPMMINDSSMPNNFAFAQLVADHEIAHTYFPFYMGINEQRYAFMDEGWATTFEYLIGISEQGQEKADEFYKNFRVRRYINDPSAEEDQPIITMSTQVSGMGYGSNSYGKASLSYLALKDYLGDDVFKKALHHYMDNWNGKHPIPWDFFYSMNTGSGQDLNWFWKNWFFSYHYIDLKIENAQQSNQQLKIDVDNVGGFAIPFDVKITYTDGSSESKHFTPEVWKNNEKKTSLTISAPKSVKSINIDGGIFMDYTPEDNQKTL